MELEAIYRSYKPLLFSIAYRMLGSVSDAEDLVQDTFASLTGQNGAASGEPVRSWKAFLCKAVTNRCLDLLKSARKKRELYVGPWLPEPYVQGYLEEYRSDPAESAVMEESVTYAFLVMLDRLTPAERAVFILREAFGYDYGEIAYITGKTATGCRQIFSRVKRKVQSESHAQAAADLEHSEALVKRFIQASATGNLQELVDMLTEDITLYSDGGGKVLAALNPIRTPQRVLQFLAGLSAKAGDKGVTRFAVVNGEVGLVVYGADAVPTIATFEIRDGKIHRIYLMRNPDKLKHLAL